MHNHPKAPGLLRLELSDRVRPETLSVLHSSGLTEAVPVELRDLISRAGGESLKAVYPLSKDEIREDKYGFAREFELRLQVSVDSEVAIRLLRSSPFVKPVVLKRSWENP